MVATALTSSVMPAQAGIHTVPHMDSRLRGHDVFEGRGNDRVARMSDNEEEN